MSVAAIVAKIASDARAESEKIAARAKTKIAELKKSAELKVAEVEKFWDEKAVEKISGTERKIGNLIAAERKSIFSRAKKEILDEVFVAARKEFSNLKTDELVELFGSALKTIPEKTGEIVPARGAEEVCKKAIATAGKNFTLGAAGGFDGGFIFVGEKTEIDFSFETIFEKVLRSKLELEI
jgi:vacuolar-type H+-ATPase subunit E/Vma4